MIRALLLVVVTLLALSACGGMNPTPTPDPTDAPAPITTPEAAVARIVALEPRLTGIQARDPELIGQSAWYEVVPASGVGAFLVAVQVGWGDCQAGCIDAHTWTFAVQPDGTVVVQRDEGPDVPDDAWPSPGGDGRTGIRVQALAGPVCPVETVPADPACAPRPVSGATVVILDADGQELQRVQLDANGLAVVELEPGAVSVVAQPMDGLMRTPAPVAITVTDGTLTPVPLAYDTGIL